MNPIRTPPEPGRGLWIGGPTASGKSEVALRLAEILGGEIVTVDSMQVYRGMDIGTAKPSEWERQLVPHHLVDVVGLSEAFSAGAFVAQARPLIDAILSRRRLPVLCGGSGLYYKALLDGLGSSCPPDPDLRWALESTPLQSLIGELLAKDPESVTRIDVRNRRRVVRAVEQVRLSGSSAVGCRAPWPPKPGAPLPGFYALTRGTDDLRERINARVDRMMDNGLVEETRRLLAEGLAHNRTAMQAIGYRQVVEYLQGIRSLTDTVALIKHKTWQFARRQRNWFDRQLPARAVEVSSGQAAAEIAQHLLALWREAQQDAGKHEHKTDTIIK
jgi:tRNA dimethylallyltransferase